MRTKTLISVALALFLMGVAILPRTAAQETPKEIETQLKPSISYKVDFTVNELDNGKKINSRSYSMLIRAEDVPKFTRMKNLRIGSRVPYPMGSLPTQFQFQDVGMNIDCRLMPIGNGNVTLDATWDYTALADPQADNHAGTFPPVFRTVRSSVESVVPSGKSTVLAEMDDVASTRHYVFEVKVTKISE